MLDYVEDYAALCSCSRAASCMRPYAQERLFASVQVDATKHSNNLSMLRYTLKSTTLARYTSFSTLPSCKATA